MVYFRKLKLSFLSVVFLIFLPIIIIISTTMALVNYKELYEHILNQIDNKLVSISSITASFIDGDDYKLILNAKQMKAYAYDLKTDKLYALDYKNNLNIIDLKLGAAKLVKGLDLKSQINDINFAENSILYAITNTNEIVSIDIKANKTKVIKKLDIKVDSIVYDDNKKLFYLSSQNKLYSFDRKLKLLKEFEHNLSSLVIKKDQLYGIDRKLDKLFNISLIDLNFRYINIKDFPKDTSDIYNLAIKEDIFYLGDKHLVILNNKNGSLKHEDFARMYRDESLDIYKKYIKSMSEIKVALGLTFHYTFNLLYGDANNNCYYIFDVHEGNEYTPIGSYDVMDKDDLVGAENVMYRDQVYVGDVKLWENWGLLKVAYAGIKDKKGNTVGIAGTDVDISFIKSKTHEALVYSISIGIVTLVLSIFASYYIAIKIIKPIEKLKVSALKIAAGNYEEKVFIDSPLELSKLSSEFNRMSDQLTLEIKNFKNYSLEIKERKASKEIHKKLYVTNDFKDKKIKIQSLDSSLNPHGVIQYDNKYYAWSQKNKLYSRLDVAKESAIMTDTLYRLLRGGEDINIFKQIYELDVFLMIDINSYKVIDIIKGGDLEYSLLSNDEINVGDMTIKISPNNV